LIIRYFVYNFGEPIYYALVTNEVDFIKEYIWVGDRWTENNTNYLEYLRFDGSPHLDNLSEEQIAKVATPIKIKGTR